MTADASDVQVFVRVSSMMVDACTRDVEIEDAMVTA